MKSIGFKNFRSLKDLNKIELKNLTILIGKNSCGKSTFLRAFPLFKQTLSTDRSIPILWYSESLVDFGDFSKVKNMAAEENENISFLFENRTNSKNFPFTRIANSFDYSAELSISKTLETEFISTIKLRVNEDEFLLNFTSDLKLDKIIINNTFSLEVDFLCNFRNGILPSLSSIYSESSKFRKDAGDYLKKIFPNNKQTALNDRRSNKMLTDIFFERQLISKEKFIHKFRSQFNKQELSEEEILELYYFYLMDKFEDIYTDISFDISSFFGKTHYIAPIRATPQRYYRMQGLAVENVDSTGRNLALFLKSLSSANFNSLKDWINKYFSFNIDIQNIEGHTTVNIVQKGKKINLTDTGFGYSQLLPIIVQIWYSTVNNKKFYFDLPIITFAIEQPELHLHPALQIKLIDAFIEILNKLNSSGEAIIKFIIETHSETFINRIGENIWKNKLNQNDVIIYRFEKENFETKIIETEYDSEGSLKEWPIGFFSAEECDDFWS